MISSQPASRSTPLPSIGKQRHTCGGNLARPMSSRTGLLSFTEFPEQFPAQVSNAPEFRLPRSPGRKLPLTELAEITGLPYQRLNERIVRRGWDVERAVTEAPRGW